MTDVANQQDGASGSFEDRRRPEIQPWRPLDEWEEAVLWRHLAVEFEAAQELRALPRLPRVREMDECGCLKFEREDEATGKGRIVTDGYGLDHPDGPPFQTMLTLTDEGHLLWLEYHRFGGDGSFRPNPGTLRLIPFGGEWPIGD